MAAPQQIQVSWYFSNMQSQPAPVDTGRLDVILMHSLVKHISQWVVWQSGYI